MSKTSVTTNDLQAVEAVEAAVHQLRERIMSRPIPAVDVADIVTSLEEGLAGRAPRTLDCIQQVADSYASYVQRLGGSTATSLIALSGLSRILQVADEELFADADRACVAEAEVELTTAETAYANAREQLDKAFRSNDAAAIDRFRTEVEVTLPHEVDQARLLVKRRQLELAESLVNHPKLRNQRTSDALAVAEDDVARAETLLDQARVSRDHWTDLSHQSASSLRVRTEAVEAAAQALAALEAETSALSSNRLAHLTGARR